MNNKKILVSFLLVVLMAISLSAVSAVDDIGAGDVDDVVAAEDSVDVLSEPKQPDNNTAEAVDTVIQNANDGDTIDLSNNPVYELKDKVITIEKNDITIKGNGTTTIYTYGDAGKNTAAFIVKGSNVVFQGLVFIDNNPDNNFTYGDGGKVIGTAIRAQNAINTTIKDCNFTDFEQAIRIQNSNTAVIENNYFSGGYTTYLLNDPTKNVETGSKMVSVGGSLNVKIINNTFNGPMLDGLSLFGGSGGNNLIADNIFIGNAYAIYFGGASTKGSVLRNNTFINCGSFKKDGENWTGLPVVSIQKSSDGIAITGNKFQSIDDNILISAESGNEAHGGATRVGNITITENTVTSYDGSADMSTVTLFRVLIRGTSFEMDDALVVKDNTFPDGVKGISIVFDGHEIYTADETVMNNTLYPETLYGTTLEVSDVTINVGETANLIITLKDSNNNTLRDKPLTIIINGLLSSAITDAKGVATVPVVGDVAGIKYVTITYAGEGSIYKSSIANAKITVNAKSTPASNSSSTSASTTPVAKKTTLTAKKATLKVKKAKKIKVTLKSEGKAVKGKVIKLKVNKKTFKAKTNAKGVATIKVKVAKKGKFTAKITFAGDKDYKASSKSIKLTVK